MGSQTKQAPAARRSLRPWLGAGLLLALLAAGLALAFTREEPPAPPSQGQLLLGSWQEMRRGNVVEFRADGTVFVDQRHLYNYELPGENRLRMTAVDTHGHEEEGEGAQGEQQPAVVDAMFTISDEVLTVTPDGGRSDSFRRVQPEPQ